MMNTFWFRQPLPISVLIQNFRAPPHGTSWRKLSLHELLHAEYACPTLGSTKINDFRALYFLVRAWRLALVKKSFLKLSR
jgi:hypothetical protein